MHAAMGQSTSDTSVELRTTEEVGREGLGSVEILWKIPTSFFVSFGRFQWIMPPRGAPVRWCRSTGWRLCWTNSLHFTKLASGLFHATSRKPISGRVTFLLSLVSSRKRFGNMWIGMERHLLALPQLVRWVDLWLKTRAMNPT